MKSDHLTFTKIINAAKALNPALLPSDAPIDITILDDSTPAELLARQNHRKAAGFLLNLGANIHCVARGAAQGGQRVWAEALIGRGAYKSYVARGAAQGGHQVWAEALIERGANINHVAQGAALGGHQVWAEALIGRGAHIDYVARIAAQGGHQDWAEALIGRGANIDYVAQGAAQGGHQGWAEALIARGANIDYVAHGAARGGYQEWAEALIGRGAHIDYVAHGAARGGYQEWAEALIGRGAHIDSVAQGAAQSGYQEWAEALIGRGAHIDSVAQGAAQSGYQEWAEALIGRGANIHCVAQGAADGGHVRNDKSIVKWLSHCTAQPALQQWTQALCAVGVFPYQTDGNAISLSWHRRAFPKKLLGQIRQNHALMHPPFIKEAQRVVLQFSYYEARLLLDPKKAKAYAAGSFLLRYLLLSDTGHHMALVALGKVTLPHELWLLVLSILFDLPTQLLLDFGNKLQLATVASTSNAEYTKLFSTKNPFTSDKTACCLM